MIWLRLAASDSSTGLIVTCCGTRMGYGPIGVAPGSAGIEESIVGEPNTDGTGELV